MKLCASLVSVVTPSSFPLDSDQWTKPTLTDCATLMKQHFICVEQTTGTTVVNGEVNILITLLNMSVIHRSICGAL
jgi:hypothetical protein